MTDPCAGAIVLAGGLSSRMGEPKAGLRLDDGRTLLDVITTSLAAVCEPVIVVGRRGVDLPTVTAPVVRADDPAPFEGQGPLAGMLAGLQALAARQVDRAFVCACDHALLTPAHVTFVLGALVRDPPVELVAVRSDDGFVQPLGGALRVAPARAAAHGLLTRGVRKVGALCRELDTREVAEAALPDPEGLAPCNTPEQWAKLRGRIG